MSDNSPWWGIIYIVVSTLICIAFATAYTEGKYLMLDKVVYPEINEMGKVFTETDE